MSDMKWAKEYLVDPLNAPDPSDETGPGTHFRSTFAGMDPSRRQSANMTPPDSAKLPASPSKNPFRDSMLDSKSGVTGHTRSVSNPSRSSYPSPPNSATHSRNNSLNPFDNDPARKRQSLDSHLMAKVNPKGRARGNSLGARFPGDQSNKPLDIIRRDSKRAAHAPHLRRKHLPGPDLIDRLDESVPGAAYHHEGPFDATLLARNSSFGSSPVAAVARSNEEALRATPRENVLDAVERHRPLDGVAIIPPGQEDRFGRRYDYQEGENLMIDLGGNYKRWPGMDYAPDDLKGKGEPQFSIDKARKEAKRREQLLLANAAAQGEPEGGIELQEAPAIYPKGANDASAAVNSGAEPVGAFASASGSASGVLGRSKSMREGGAEGRKGHFGGLKRRIGSLRRRLD